MSTAKRVRFSEVDGDSSVARLEVAEKHEGELKRKWQQWTGPNSLPGEGSADAPAYGELNYSSVKKVLDYLEANCGLGGDCSFLDIGHGRGVVPLSVAHRFPNITAYGVEIDQYRYDISVQYAKDTPNCVLIHADFSSYDHFIAATIIYAFDRGFERTPGKGPMHAMARTWNQSDTSARWLVSFRTPSEWDAMGLQHYSLIAKIPRLRSRGGRSSFTAYVYKRVF